ncbi:MAG: hypothetical protein ACK2T0_04980 [Anaerolineales bacterium]
MKKNNYVRFGATVVFAAATLLGACSAINEIGNSAPPPTKPVIVSNSGSINTWPNDSHMYFNGEYDLTVRTGIIDVLNFYEGATKMRSYDSFVPADTSGYHLEKETADNKTNTRTDEYDVKLGNLSSHGNCTTIQYTLKTTSLNKKYLGQVEQTSLPLTFVNKGPRIIGFSVPKTIKQGVPFQVYIQAVAKKAELYVQTLGTQPSLVRTFLTNGCGKTITEFVPQKIQTGNVTYILRVWNEAGRGEWRSESRGTLPTSGVASVYLQKNGAVAGVLTGQALEPPHAGLCKAIITDVTTPYTSYTPAGGSAICTSGNAPLAVSHTDANGVQRSVDPIGCRVDTSAFNGQTVAGDWGTNFSVNGGYPPNSLLLNLKWKLPSNCN